MAPGIACSVEAGRRRSRGTESPGADGTTGRSARERLGPRGRDRIRHTALRDFRALERIPPHRSGGDRCALVRCVRVVTCRRRLPSRRCRRCGARRGPPSSSCAAATPTDACASSCARGRRRSRRRTRARVRSSTADSARPLRSSSASTSRSAGSCARSWSAASIASSASGASRTTWWSAWISRRARRGGSCGWRGRRRRWPLHSGRVGSHCSPPRRSCGEHPSTRR